MLKMVETLYVTHRNDWRAWLKKNHVKKKDIWLIYYKKHTGKPRIPYDDAVEEALCFGWIDSIVKKLDDEKYSFWSNYLLLASWWLSLCYIISILYIKFFLI